MRSVWIALVLILLSESVNASSCGAEVQLQVLGAGGPEITDSRVSSGYQFWLDGRSRLLLDTGSGSSFSFEQSQADFADVDAVLLSHLHTDHSADLPTYIKGSFFTRRNRDLLVIGPDKNSRMPATSEFITRLFGQEGAFPYLSDYLQKGLESYQILSEDVPMEKGAALYEKAFPWGKVTAISVNHGPIPALAWRIQMAGCVVVYSGDLSNKTDKLAQFAQQADLLVIHMAIPESAGQIAKSLHVTPTEIAQIAATAKPRQLLISHLMRRSEPELSTTLKQIQENYAGKVVVAQRLLTVPVSSRGAAK
ncbi:MBL fold metallo-hydrolase [Planctobacterium marinum]|uniref:Arylsulfatase n=1 Tax=Planctobacterium marinum TaxID=1631968 RepID=A0AA48KPE6_9ALTE|nr:arylsulfatase [Planctobacterium marinum]